MNRGSKEGRASNIELLRIIAMLMIVFYHIYCHTITNQLADGYHTAFGEPIFNSKLLVLGLTAPLGKVGNVIFILITGYFLPFKRSEISLMKVAKKILYQMGVATLFLVIGSTLFFLLFNERLPYLNFYLPDINIFNESFWFAGYYFAIVLIAKCVLNKLILESEERKLGEILAILFSLSQFSWVVDNLWGIASGLVTLLSGLFLYMFGGFLRRFSPFQKVKGYVFLLIIVCADVLICLSTYNSMITKIELFSGEGLFIPSIVQYKDNSLLPIIIGISLFSLFERIRIPNSRIINYVGSSTFMVYLMHDNDFFYSIWNTQDWVTKLSISPAGFLLKLLGWTLATFSVGFCTFSVYYIGKKIFFKIMGNK